MLLLKKTIVALFYFSALYNLAECLPITENTQDTEEVLATTEIFEEIASEEENLLDNDYPERQTESEQRGISYQMFKWILPKIQQTKIAITKI